MKKNTYTDHLKQEYKKIGRPYLKEGEKYEILWDDELHPISVWDGKTFISDDDFEKLCKEVRTMSQTIYGEYERVRSGVWDFHANKNTELIYECEGIDLIVKVEGYSHTEDGSGDIFKNTQHFYFNYEGVDDDCNDYKFTPMQEARLELIVLQTLEFDGEMDTYRWHMDEIGEPNRYIY